MAWEYVTNIKGEPQFAYEGTEPPPDLPIGALFLDTDDIPTGGAVSDYQFPSATWSLAETTGTNPTWVGTWKYLKLTLPASMGSIPKFGYEDFYVPPCPPEYLAAIRENRRIQNGSPVDHYEPYAQVLGTPYSVEADFYAEYHRVSREVNDPDGTFDSLDCLFPAKFKPGALTVETVVDRISDRVVSLFRPSDFQGALRAIWSIQSDPEDVSSPTVGQLMVEGAGLTWPMGITDFVNEVSGMVPQELLDLIPAGYTLGQALVLFIAEGALNQVTTHPPPLSMRQSP